MYANRYYRADSAEALAQLNAYANTLTINEDHIKERYIHNKKIHDKQRQEWKKQEDRSDGNSITLAWLSACIREAIDEDTIIVNEAITSSGFVLKHIPRNKPGTFFNNGGSSLGWSGGAAIGAKLARPDKMVVCLTGDGTYMLSVPSSVHYVARRYKTPFLTVIYNNQGWNATKRNALALYPDGSAKQDDRLYVNFDQPSDLSKIAEAAGGAYAQMVENLDELPEALRRGVEEVKNGRSAVIDVRFAKISNQTD
jgi:acetolactate synthase-1/2/3 large subunit